jgi:hypothetical protein
MAMNTEELQDYKDSLANLSAEELRGQLGDDDEQDALINAQLAGGKAVELKGAPAAGEDDDAGQGKTGAHHGLGDGAEDDDDQDEGEDDDDTDPAAAPAATAPAPAAEAAPAAAAAEVVAEVPELAPAAAPAVAVAPLDLSYLDAKRDAEFAKLDAAKAEGLTKLMAGEIEAAEYAKIDAQYMRDRDAVRENLKSEGDWMTQVHAFKAQALATSGINYDADTEKAQAWDDWVKRLADKPEHANLSGEQFLALAHKKVLAEFDIAPKATPAPAPAPATTAAPAPAAAAPAPAKKGRAPDLSTIPPSLGALPAASNPGAGDGGEFAHIDNLTGMAYERALAGLSADQKARYEAA